jgi:hypothetical protein
MICIRARNANAWFWPHVFSPARHRVHGCSSFKSECCIDLIASRPWRVSIAVYFTRTDTKLATRLSKNARAKLDQVVSARNRRVVCRINKEKTLTFILAYLRAGNCVVVNLSHVIVTPRSWCLLFVDFKFFAHTVT